ncbi:MAG: HD domain-containing protein [Planctomycetota bacterium]
MSDASNAILSVPEISALDSSGDIIRISPGTNVPLTPRVRRLVDTEAFRRLSRVSQLGLVSLVYPSATHSRFEHSLGVYREALLFLRQLSHDPRFRECITAHDAECLIVSALLHDLGHWPFCHPIEDMRLAAVPRHEEFIEEHLREGELADLLRSDWDLEPTSILDLLAGRCDEPAKKVLSSILSGPIDIDKIDYLQRDSLHAGVPYGQHFDRHRLVASLCLNERGDGLAITEKGKTAAELMVFSRYVMFSEVYWHHSVRAATAMLQRGFFGLHDRVDLTEFFRLSDADWIGRALSVAPPEEREILDGLFGSRRRLYKRVNEYSFFEDEELYNCIARRPFDWLVRLAAELASHLSANGGSIGAHELIIDAPPVEKEVEFHIEVFSPKSKTYRQLESISPVVRTLAKEQFDDYVKRVRVFAHPRHVERLRSFDKLPRRLLESAKNLAE